MGDVIDDMRRVAGVGYEVCMDVCGFKISFSIPEAVI